MPKERTGYRESIFDQKMETPKTMVYITYSGKEKYNLKNTIVMSMLSQVMRTVYTETIREEEGGTYGVSTSGSLSRTPKNSFSYVIAFDTNKEQASSLADRTIAKWPRKVRRPRRLTISELICRKSMKAVSRKISTGLHR